MERVQSQQLINRKLKKSRWHNINFASLINIPVDFYTFLQEYRWMLFLVILEVQKRTSTRVSCNHLKDNSSVSGTL